MYFSTLFVVLAGSSTITYSTILHPVVATTSGNVMGNTDGGLQKFLGIPYAAPPIKELRFAPPQPFLPVPGIIDASSYGAACIQQTYTPISFSGFTLPTLPVPANTSEDCLFINIVRPAAIQEGTLLPVVFYIYGGSFTSGDSTIYPGDTVVNRSMDLGIPVIHVIANYRLNALGFLGGAEVQLAKLGNIGLRDQRFAMQWAQDNIFNFGGDPSKITLWGESSGAMSVGIHMVVNNGNQAGLFHRVFMESGFPFPLSNITSKQKYFDELVANTGCASIKDKLGCLRNVPIANLSKAINLSPNLFSYTSIEIPWQPTVDYYFITWDPQISIKEGFYSRVPIVAGDVDDEGTDLSLSTLNITNNEQFLSYVQSNFFPGASTSQITKLGLEYPDDPVQGSPFDTGSSNAITPEYKRMAALVGDFVFQAPRRFLLQIASKTQPAYAYLYKRGKQTPILGSAHAFDIAEFFGFTNFLGANLSPSYIGTDALINFVNTGNPNIPMHNNSLLSALNWPLYCSNASAPPLFTFLDPAPTIAITADTFRIDPINFITSLSLQIYGQDKKWR